MKNIFITLCLVHSLFAFSQKKNNNEDLILFERTVAIQEMIGEELDDLRNYGDTLTLSKEAKLKKTFEKELKENILDKVIDGYEELIEKFPKSKLVFRALNNKGYAELELEDNANAKTTFLSILNSKANDKEKGGIGSGIMGEPYANYKNRACKILADLELKDKNYQEAIQYLDRTKEYPYRHFCGNEYAANDIYMANMYSKCYLALNEYDKALDILLPNIIENGLAGNSFLVKTTVDALLKNHTKESLKFQFETAFKNISAEKEIRNKEEYTYYYIHFLNRKIQLNAWDLYAQLPKEEFDKTTQRILTESYFYKLVSQ